MTAVVVDATGRRMLRVPSGAGRQTPVVTVPDRVHFPDVTVLLQALADQHGIDAVALECLDRHQPDQGPVELEALLELRPGARIPDRAVWVADLPPRAAAALARPGVLQGRGARQHDHPGRT